MKLHLVAAARPNFMKVAPLFHAARATDWLEPVLVQTGQHYDANMSDAFFQDLRLPSPSFHLGVGSGTHAEQTGGVMIAYERVVEQNRPDALVVVGDVNSTAACAIVGAKAGIPVIHLEAGLRSRDRSMPEEINRLVTDAITDVFWTPSIDADENLRREGVPADRIDFVGNIMIDSFRMMSSAITEDGTARRMGLLSKGYAVVTLHRPSNVDDSRVLAEIVGQLLTVASELPLVFAAHPRTRRRLQEFSLFEALCSAPNVLLVEPLGYVQFMNLVVGARAVITDSGGVQEETTYLGIPCLTLRDNTERPVTVTEGTNRLLKSGQLKAAVSSVLAGNWPTGRRPAFWDGQAADRCLAALRRRFAT
jgi:UDP-N-acetylglucosamine 2-epimerase (non-hydrolysing)